MRPHIFLSFGILMLVIFVYRGIHALLSPGIGISEAYVFGGLVLSGWLMFIGSRELLAMRKARQQISAQIEG
jgi:hypothetical protein